VPPWSSGSVLDYRLLPPCSNLGVGISEGCFVFDFTSLPLEVTHLAYLVHKSGRKNISHHCIRLVGPPPVVAS